MAKNRDKTPAKARKTFMTVESHAVSPKRVRVIQVVPTYGGGRDDHFYHVRAGGSEGEILYVSQNYVNKTVAKNAGIREHEGRAKFDYIIEWTDNRSGALKRETL